MRTSIPILAMATLYVCACTKQSNTPSQTAAPSAGTPPVSHALMEYFVSQKAGVPADKVDTQVRETLVRELEELEVAAAAEETNATPEIQEEIQLQRIELLAHAGAIAAGVFAPPSDAELKAEYDGFVASLPAQEFHVAHILVATESAAQILITKLQGGTEFAKLARERSADDSEARGGDLGWIAPGKLPVDFTNAVQALKPGQITAHPVHTIYGWHVIKLLESRPATPPPFEQVKAQLTANLQQARYKKFLESALANAKIAKGY